MEIPEEEKTVFTSMNELIGLIHDEAIKEHIRALVYRDAAQRCVALLPHFEERFPAVNPVMNSLQSYLDTHPLPPD